MSICPSCGSEVKPGNVFCGACGVAVAAAAEQVVRPPAPVAATPASAPTPVSSGRWARRRSWAWIYYTFLTIVCIVLAVKGTPQTLIGAALFGLYAVYLYRGGRFVIWFW